MRRFAWLALLLAGCTDDAPTTTVAFDLGTPLAGETFWDLPFPMDLRLDADGRPDLAGFPNRRNLPVVADLLSSASERRGFPVMPIAYFRFIGEQPQHTLDTLAHDAVLVDIDAMSPEYRRTFPVVAHTLPADDYGSGLVAVAPRPGIVLRGNTRYAIVLKRSFAPDAAVPAQFAQLRDGTSHAAQIYAPLWPVLDALHIDDPLVATVFTTGDEIEALLVRSEVVRNDHDATITNIRRDTTSQNGFCSYTADVTVPVFQTGEPPYSTGGRFVVDDECLPIAQGTTTIPLKITLPAAPMPARGYPLWQYFHGSGGASFDLVDEGRTATIGGAPAPGQGPGAVVARRGIAAAAAALPLNGERLPGAGDYDYLNINNLAAFPYTFQQGVFEQRLLLDALLALELPTCDGTATARFDATTLTAGGHSMGGMYTNMIGAVEARYGAVTPFGAGGLWNMMILDTAIVPGARGLLGSVLGTDGDQLTFVHPALGLIELGWEIADPMNAMARLARRPFEPRPAKHVYQPIGLDDKYFPNEIFDAAALAYGNQQAGEIVWTGTQDALAADGMDGMLQYPVKANRGATTNVVVQYRDDGIVDAHQIYRQLDEVKQQYSCFLATYIRFGVPSVVAPGSNDGECW